jgi:K+-sensing histidine kinase KdpD
LLRDRQTGVYQPIQGQARLEFHGEDHGNNRHHIQHLLVHLITNSSDAKKDATITIRSFVKDNKNCVEIQDDGPGFPEKFRKQPSAVFNLSNGGYGLFLCKSIIEKHKGEIKILHVDKGVSVQFSIPVTK